MEFISAEQFLSQPKEVQKVFLAWWNHDIGDLFLNKFNYRSNPRMISCLSENDIMSDSMWFSKEECIPLLTEGQLRRFIEYKTESKIWKIEFKRFPCGYSLELADEEKYKKFNTLHQNILDCLWEIACKIVKECFENERN